MNTIKKTLFAIITIATIVVYQSCKQPTPVADTIKVASIFSNNMVLQRDQLIPVWGKATPNHKVEVQFKKQRVSTVTGSDSNWRLNLKPEKAGGPFVMKVIGTDTLTFNNVMVGEVWVCSGQSNMEMPLGNWGKVNHYKQEIANADYPDIRLLTIPDITSLTPLDDVDIPSWLECSPETVETFSATSYFFARNLYKKLHVPIGLIHSSVGGTPVEAWMPENYIKQVKSIKPIVPYNDRTAEKEKQLLSDYDKDVQKWEKTLKDEVTAIDKNNPDFSKPGFNDSKWKTINLPKPWEEGSLGDIDGVVWFRKTFKVKGKTKNIKKESYTISLGRVHDANKTYLNGKLIGQSFTRWGSEATIYHIPAGVIKKGKNTLAVEITNLEWIGGITGEKEDLWLKNSNGQKIDLAGEWKLKLIFNLDKLPPYPISPVNSDEPAVLYNAKINPLIPYAMRGWIWYQGENNAWKNPLTYDTTFPLFIKAMREVWGEGDFPFLYVQLANFEKREPLPGPSNWAVIREAQLKALSLPNTGMAVAIDIGNATNIHPKNKQEVGRRLAIIALNKVYDNKTVEFSGPVYQSVTFLGDTAIISFSYAEKGLKTSNGKNPTAFAIAGNDKKFKWAKTKIVGNKIYVWNDNVPNPKAVRYGWADNPACNLTGENGLPVSPFRTDDWRLKVIR